MSNTLAGRAPAWLELEGESEAEPWPQRLGQAVRRHGALVLAMPILLAGVAAVATKLIAPYYVADGTMVIEHPSAHLAELTPQDYPPAADEERDLQTELTILGSRAVADPVIAQLDLARRDPEIARTLAAIDRSLARKGWRLSEATRQQIAAGEFAKKLTLLPDKISRTIHIEYGSRDQALTAAVVNQVAASYQAVTLQARQQQGASAAAWLNQQLRSAQSGLDADDAALEGFQREHGYIPVASPAGPVNALADRLADANKALSAATAERLADQALLQSYSGEVVAALPAELRDPAIEKAAENVSAAAANLDTLTPVYQDGFPAVAEARARLANEQHTLAELRDEIAQGLQQRLAAAQAKEQELSAQVAQLRQQASAASGDDLRYTLLKQRDEGQRALYETLRQKLSEVALMATLPPTNLRVLDAAEAPLLPAYPRLPLDLGLGAGLGLALGIAAALGRENWSDALRASEKVERGIGAGTAPLGLIAEESSRAGRLLPAAGGAGGAEAYARIAAQLRARCGAPPRAVVVTSANPGEGKTRTSCQLGLALARGGWRTLLVDADVRRPGCHRFFGLNQDPGLMAAQQGMTVEPVAVAPGLDLMPCEENAGLPLQARAVAALLEQWRARYDYILLDTPPANFTGDALLLATLSDGVLVVLWWGRTRRGEARQLCQEMSRAHVALLGTVFNRVDPRAPGFDHQRRERAYFGAAA